MIEQRVSHNPSVTKTKSRTVQSAFGYEGDGLDPGQQAGGTGSGVLSDDQLWYYEDPQGHIQGEFSSAQMLNWLLAGRYFTAGLRLRRKCDDAFSSLRKLPHPRGLFLFFFLFTWPKRAQWLFYRPEILLNFTLSFVYSKTLWRMFFPHAVDLRGWNWP